MSRSADSIKRRKGRPPAATCAAPAQPTLLELADPLSAYALGRILSAGAARLPRAPAAKEPQTYPLPGGAPARPRPYWGSAPKARTDSAPAPSAPSAAIATSARSALTTAAAAATMAAEAARLSAAAAATWTARFCAERTWAYAPADDFGQSPLPQRHHRTGALRLLSLTL